MSAHPDSSQDTGSHQPRIAIRIADVLPWLLLPATMPCQFVERPILSAIPNVKPWFVGAFAERGVITPVFDLSSWLDPDRPSASRRLAVLRDGGNLVGFLSLETPRVLKISRSDAIQPDTIALPEAFSPYVGTAYTAADERCIEFHPFAWVRANAARVPNTA